MLYTPKYILVAELDKKVCECSECKKFRVLYNHSQMTESKNEDICDSTSDIIAVCSKCSRMYRFDMRYIKNCLLYTSPSQRDRTRSRMPSSA